MVLQLPQGHEDSEYVLSFEIGHGEGGFYSGQTDTQTDGHTHPVPYSIIDIEPKYSYKSTKKLI